MNIPPDCMNRQQTGPTRRELITTAAWCSVAAALPSAALRAAESAASARREDTRPPLVLIHSPLVGPVFWEPAANELRAKGWTCIIATARRPTETVPPFRDWPALLSEASGSPCDPIVVAHSAAGLLLPAVARRLHARGILFLDAQLPPPSGKVAPAEAEFLAFVRSRPVTDGRLPRWSDWWDRDVLSSVIPDAQARRRFQQDEPRLTPQWFDDEVEVPAWDGLPAAYVQTSAGYAAKADAARSRGWTVITLNGTHLHAYVAPRETAEAVHTAALALVHDGSSAAAGCLD